MLNKFNVSVVLPAKDLQRANKFYTEKLGLTDTSGGKIPGLLMFTAGGNTKIVLYETDLGPGKHTEAGFEVTDLDKVIERLEGKGVKMEQYDPPGLKTEAKGIA